MWMTVKELIQKLQSYNPESEVSIAVDDGREVELEYFIDNVIEYEGNCLIKVS